MNNAGITAQYGFLFQRKAFVLFALENTGTKQTFTFEGKDDVEISTNECIYSVKTADSNYIQVKSGTVDESCFCKIICNWLLLDKIPSDTLILFAENQLEVPISNVTKDAILEYILKGKEKKKSSIARKTYGISLKIPAVPTHDRPACGRGRRAFAASAPAACGRFGRRWQREPGRCPERYCPCGRAAGWLTTGRRVAPVHRAPCVSRKIPRKCGRYPAPPRTIRRQRPCLWKYPRP